MFCQLCGTQLSVSAQFCKNCGARAEAVEEHEPSPPRLTRPSRDDEVYPRPWRQNENAIILPITRELTGEDWGWQDPDATTQIVPIDSSSRFTPAPPPRRTELIEPQERTPVPEPRPRPLETQPVFQHSQAPVKPRPRRGRLISAVPLLLLAVIFLFVLAYFATK